MEAGCFTTEYVLLFYQWKTEMGDFYNMLEVQNFIYDTIVYSFYSSKETGVSKSSKKKSQL